MVKITGREKHLKRLRGLRTGIAKGAGKLIMDMAERHAELAAQSIREGGVSGKGHTPSNPGRPPNADSGKLDRSISAERVGPLKAQSVADAPHAIPLEFGTSQIAERPFMRPAAEAVRKEAVQMAKKMVSRAIKGEGNGDG